MLRIERKDVTRDGDQERDLSWSVQSDLDRVLLRAVMVVLLLVMAELGVHFGLPLLRPISRRNGMPNVRMPSGART